MLLTIDIGNTNIVAGLFEGARIVSSTRFKTSGQLIKKHLGKYAKVLVEGVIVSSVVPSVEGALSSFVRKAFGVRPYFVGSGTFKRLMGIRLDRPKEAGADRLVNAFAANKLYGRPSVVIDFGTATTFCAVSAKGDYLGGAIAPGVAISRDALHEKTAKLPSVSLKMPKKAIGQNTISAMQSGILYGYVGIVEGLTARFKKALGGKAKVIATGGLAGIIHKETDIIDIVDTDLTLKGLRMIWEEICRKKNPKSEI